MVSESSVLGTWFRQEYPTRREVSSHTTAGATSGLSLAERSNNRQLWQGPTGSPLARRSPGHARLSIARCFQAAPLTFSTVRSEPKPSKPNSSA